MLYDAAAPKLFAIALRAVRQRDQAEDILQDVFVCVWKKAPLFDRTKGMAIAWLSSITRRKAIDALRKLSRESTGTLGDVAEEPGAAESPFWIGPETSMTVRACIRAMKPEVQQALSLCFIDGHSHDETALEMNVPLGTVKSWIRRALEVIRRDLTREPGRAAA